MSFNSEYSPSFQPPRWLFGPVWSVLYITIGISFYLTWITKDEIENTNLVIGLFAAQMVLNLLWTVIFNSEQGALSYWISTAMLILIVAFTSYYAFLVYEISPTASMLVWPYIAWVSFATLLNIAYLLEELGVVEI